MRFFTAVLASALVLAPVAIVAQTPTPTPGAHDYNINQRKVDQQDRIAQGVKSGQLTAGETSRLEDCLISGRTNCAPIDTATLDR